jgi:hypothetical protein
MKGIFGNSDSFAVADHVIDETLSSAFHNLWEKDTLQHLPIYLTNSFLFLVPYLLPPLKSESPAAQFASLNEDDEETREPVSEDLRILINLD